MNDEPKCPHCGMEADYNYAKYVLPDDETMTAGRTIYTCSRCWQNWTVWDEDEDDDPPQTIGEALARNFDLEDLTESEMVMVLIDDIPPDDDFDDSYLDENEFSEWGTKDDDEQPPPSDHPDAPIII